MRNVPIAKCLATIAVAFLMTACGEEGVGSETSAFTPPATREGADGWVEFVDAPTIDPEDARRIAPGTASPEAAVTHFYASRLRQDERFREVLVPSPSAKLERNLATLDDWRFKQFRLVARRERSPGSAWVRIWFEIEVDGDVDSGTDEVELRRVDGKWLIESVPT